MRPALSLPGPRDRARPLRGAKTRARVNAVVRPMCRSDRCRNMTLSGGSTSPQREETG
jgi:hypothetical protein